MQLSTVHNASTRWLKLLYKRFSSIYFRLTVESIFFCGIFMHFMAIWMWAIQQLYLFNQLSCFDCISTELTTVIIRECYWKLHGKIHGDIGGHDDEKISGTGYLNSIQMVKIMWNTSEWMAYSTVETFQIDMIAISVKNIQTCLSGGWKQFVKVYECNCRSAFIFILIFNFQFSHSQTKAIPYSSSKCWLVLQTVWLNSWFRSDCLSCSIKFFIFEITAQN